MDQKLEDRVKRKQFGDDMELKDVNDMATYALAALHVLFSIIKHKAFAEECEWRIHMMCGNGNTSQDVKGESSKKYFTVDPSYFSAIWISPQYDFDKMINEIKKILPNDKIQIFPSNIPYKNNTKKFVCLTNEI